MNAAAEKLLNDPSFHTLSRTERLKKIFEADNSFGDLKPVNQDRIIFEAEKGTLFPKPEPAVQPASIPSVTSEAKPFDDPLNPISLVKDVLGVKRNYNIPGSTEQQEQPLNELEKLEEPKEEQSWLERNASDFYDNSLLPLVEPRDILTGQGDMLGGQPQDIGEMVLGSAYSMPRDIIKGIYGAGEKLVQGDPGAALGQASSLALPAIGRGMKKAGWNRMRSALGPSSGREIELLDKIGPKLMEESGLPSFTQRGLEEKLIGKGSNISDARTNLAAEKAKLAGGTGTIDIDQLLQATEDVAMGPRAIKDTSRGLGDLPSDPAIAAKARDANDLVKYYQEASGTSLVDPATNTSRGLLTERDLQTLKESLQERARQGKLYDVRQGTTTPATEVYGNQAALTDDMLGQISPDLAGANERIHALLTGGETVKANRLGRIEGFAPPSEVSMVRNPGIAAASMGLGPLLGKLFRGVTTPFNTTGGVGLDRVGGALSKLSPQEALLLSLLTGNSNENPLEALEMQ